MQGWRAVEDSHIAVICAHKRRPHLVAAALDVGKPSLMDFH
jgi:hypothetical protein